MGAVLKQGSLCANIAGVWLFTALFIVPSYRVSMLLCLSPRALLLFVSITFSNLCKSL